MNEKFLEVTDDFRRGWEASTLCSLLDLGQREFMVNKGLAPWAQRIAEYKGLVFTAHEKDDKVLLKFKDVGIMEDL